MRAAAAIALVAVLVGGSSPWAQGRRPVASLYVPLTLQTPQEEQFVLCNWMRSNSTGARVLPDGRVPSCRLRSWGHPFFKPGLRSRSFASLVRSRPLRSVRSVVSSRLPILVRSAGSSAGIYDNGAANGTIGFPIQ